MRKSVSKMVKMIGISMAAALMLAACGNTASNNESTTAEESVTESESGTETTEATTAETTKAEAGDEVTIMIAAAASLEKCLEDELIPLFEEQNPGMKVVGTYDSSGKLQNQIEEGAEVDLFFSAATKQMTALKDGGLMADDTIVELLENKIVFIVPTGEEGNYSKFEDIVNADSIAIGDPASVPVGQYSEEALTNLGLWDQVMEKTSLGTNVTQVLNWVAEGSAKAGIVYATDAAQKTDSVVVVAEAPEGSVSKAIYPAGIVDASTQKESAQAFLDFLGSEEAMKIFEANGFSPAQ